jgi:hypothetical protein
VEIRAALAHSQAKAGATGHQRGSEMDLNRLINMIVRLFMRKGVNAGINFAANRGKDPKDMTPEERQQAKAARQNAKRARQAIKLGRKIGRL